jgi:hypothetical protein
VKAKKRLIRLQIDPSLVAPQHLIDRVDDDSGEGLLLAVCSSSRPSEVAEEEDDEEFNENAFQNLRDQDAFRVGEQLRYHLGPPSLKTTIRHS